MTTRRKSKLALVGWLLGLLRPYWRQATGSILCAFAAAASGLGLLATAAYLISAASLKPSVAELQMAIVAVRFFSLSRGAFRYLERLATHSVNLRLLGGLRTWLYRRLEPLAPARLTDDEAGALFARGMGGVNQLENFYVRSAAPPLAALLMILVVGFGLSASSTRLAAVWLGGAALLGLALPFSGAVLASKNGLQLAQARLSLQAWLASHLGGLADLAANNQLDASLAQAARLQACYDHAQTRSALIQSLESGLTSLVVNLGGYFLLLAAAPLVTSGQLDRLLLAVVVIGGMAAYESLQTLPAAGRMLAESLQEAAAIHDLAKRTPAVCESSDRLYTALPQEPLDLAIEDLIFVYEPGGPPALDGLNLRLPAGRKAALLGASGAGKTSLLNLLVRFWDYEHGAIYLGGANLHNLEPSAVRGAVNSFQAGAHIFNASLRSNLLSVCPQAGEERLWHALETAGLAEFTASLPSGVDTPLGEGGLRLSAGERQRLALARFLLHGGGLWVLDEPTAHLDALTAARVRRSLLAEAGVRAVLWITHDLAGLEEMDWIYILSDGRLVEEGPPAELLQSGGWYSRLAAVERDYRL